MTSNHPTARSELRLAPGVTGEQLLRMLIACGRIKYTDITDMAAPSMRREEQLELPLREPATSEFAEQLRKDIAGLMLVMASDTARASELRAMYTRRIAELLEVPPARGGGFAWHAFVEDAQ